MNEKKKKPENWVYKGYQLTENQIRYAMENTMSCIEAARWLHINYLVFKKYASMYIDEETQLTLFELQRRKNKSGRPTYKELKERNLPQDSIYRKKIGNSEYKKKPPYMKKYARMEDILQGKYPKYNKARFRRRLILEGWLPERCNICGYEERNPVNYQVPLRLVFKDNNVFNLKLDNLQFVCFNCYYNAYNQDPIGARSKKYNLGDDGVITYKTDELNRKYFKNPELKKGPYYNDRLNILSRPIQTQEEEDNNPYDIDYGTLDIEKLREEALQEVRSLSTEPNKK